MKTAEEMLEKLHKKSKANNPVISWVTAIEAMQDYASQSRWISVEERMPENKGHDFSDKVLIIDKFKNISVGRYDYMKPAWHVTHAYSGITHWQPLPTPPEKQQETDFKCKCGFGCNSIEALSWHQSECNLKNK